MFAVVAQEVAGCLNLPLVSVIRFDAGEMAVHVGAWGRENPFRSAIHGSWTNTAQPGWCSIRAVLPGSTMRTSRGRLPRGLRTRPGYARRWPCRRSAVDGAVDRAGGGRAGTRR